MGGNLNDNNVGRSDRCACASPRARANYTIKLLEEMLEVIIDCFDMDCNDTRSPGAVNMLKNNCRINIDNEIGRLLQTENDRMVHETKKFRGENKINEGKTEALSGLREEVRRP
mmetsp:Transcript_56112/g.100877  ORF Transcript_56112/g.100877 Transcript_56112/m.100877 type:complete len:114 (-) Transcript_56112:52-393(-)